MRDCANGEDLLARTRNCANGGMGGDGGGMRLVVMEERLAICRLATGEAVPVWALRGALTSVTRTPDELSIVVAEAAVPDGVRAERGWRALRVEGPLPLSAVGILAGIAAPLAAAGVNLFALSTFDTDYVLVPEALLTAAAVSLTRAGHTVAC
jgi:hypothetical protein